MKKKHSWLSLISLEWLSQGKTSIQSFGTISLQNDSVHLELKKGLVGTLNGKRFVAGTIAADKDKVEIGTKALAVIERGGKYGVRIWDSGISARKNFKGIPRYPVTPAWNIRAVWIPYDTPKQVDIPTVIPDLVQKGIAPGIAQFTIDGTEYRLEPTVEEGSNDYFFVFGDKTNGKETYGAGRFLYADSLVNGMIYVDFNKSYNPPCVFTDYATCPVPSRNNILPVRIEAGEKNYKKQ